MSTRDAKSKSALGFLTVVEDPTHGLFGGYLVLNPSGRPLEFHCTAPIKPNRAQQILYGSTLEPYLFGEQIGQTLVAKSQIEPLAVCTDSEPVLAVAQYIRAPVLLVLPPDEPPDRQTEPDGRAVAGDEGKLRRLDAGHLGGLKMVRLGRNRLAVPNAVADGRREIDGRIAALVQSFDLTEPFTRIRQAIEEARQGG